MIIIPRILKFHSLTGQIDKTVMEDAFKSVKKNRGSAGLDKISIKMFENNLEQNLDKLMRELKSRSYQPVPLKRVYIPKDNGKLRPLGIPTVRCRVAQEVVRRLIEPIFEPMFHDDSFGFRPNRNCHDAVRKVLEYSNMGYKVVFDADIKAFFDNIDHNLIMELLAAQIADGNILGLVEKFLRSGLMEDGKFIPTTKGTPQGGVISPLLANIVLNYLDWLLHAKGFKFVRYADDFVVMCKSIHQAEKAKDLVNRILGQDLKLELNYDKTNIVRFGKGLEFLGFFISSRTITMRTKSIEKFKTKIRNITKRKFNLDKNLILKLNRVIRGTVNFFSSDFTTTVRLFTEMDKWIRMRLRCMHFKRKWHTDNRRLKNKHFRNLGLLSCKDICITVKERYLATPLIMGLYLGGRPVRESCTPVNMGN